MFQEGDYIVYRNTGVCRVEKIGIPDGFPADVQEVLYYFLAPVRDSSIIYIPVNSQVFMRPVISKEEAQRLIASIPSIEEQPDYSKDHKTLSDHYKMMLQSHDCGTLLQLIKNIYRKKQELEEKGKSSGKAALAYLKQAEQLLHEELSIALGIPFEDIPSYIRTQLESL